MQNAGLYIHIPFCIQKCLYCDFLSFADHFSCASAYTDAVCGELEIRSEECTGLKFDSIFIGGGTPSCVDPALIARILNRARQVLHFTEDTEITLEMNPGTLKAGMLEQYKEMGINRISVGVQSTSDRLLQSMGRIHNGIMAQETAMLLQNHHFTNLNFDFISGIPGILGEEPENMEEAMADMDFVRAANATHVSVYSMITEPDTPLYRLTQAGHVTPCDEELERAMYHATCRKLTESGFIHYEISNFALPGHACRHNLKYWQCAPYLGVGLGSTSCLPAQNGQSHFIRHTNCRDLKQYIEDCLCEPDEMETLSLNERRDEYMMLGFRMLKGPDIKLYTAMFERDIWKDYGSKLEHLCNRGLIHPDLSLTLHGLDYGNEIFREFV